MGYNVGQRYWDINGRFTFWLFNIAMEHGPFIDGLIYLF